MRMKKLNTTADDCIRGNAMNSFRRLFYKLNNCTFDFIVSKKAAIILGLFYFLVLVIGLIYFGPLSQIENGKSTFQISLIYYVAILCFITVEAYCSFLQFTKYAADIAREANDVKLSDSEIEAVEKRLYHIMRYYTPVCTILISLGVAYVFVSNTELNLSAVSWLQMYAGFLVFFAALSTILAYTSLIFDVTAIQAVYNGTFKKYIFFYPVSTKIFREYNKIITRGLIKFWLVGSCVLFLTFIVVVHKGPIFITVTALAVIGFLLFTFFPFYITKKKIIELKMQTIASLVDAENIIDDQHIQSRESTIKFVQESPSQISTNYYTLYWSTLLALISAIVSLKDLLPLSV